MIIVRNASGPHVDRAGGKGRALLSLQGCYSNVPALFILCPESDAEIEVQAESILAAFEVLRAEHVAVRSSASVEDQVHTTFAGMFETRLNVTRSTLLDAVRYVYRSKDSPRVRDYCEERGLGFDTITMSVIVQRQVPSEVSGVCLSRYEHNGKLGVVEACWGLGEAIVQGRETPDRYIFDRENPERILEVAVGNQLHMVRHGCEIDYAKMTTDWDAGTLRTLVPAHKRLRKKLVDRDIARVAELALRIEAEQSFDVADIEFAISNGDLFLLQARPGPKLGAQRAFDRAVATA